MSLGNTAAGDADAGNASATDATVVDAAIKEGADAGADAGDGDAGSDEPVDGAASSDGEAGDADATAAAAAEAGEGKGKDGKAAADAAAKAAADNWRLAIAGSNQDALKELARIKSPEDLGKLLLQQKQALSKRAELPKLPANATPKQVAEYRKQMGAPDTVEGYGIAAPKDYKVSAVETAMLTDFAKAMHAKHAPAALVKEAADTFFKAQVANQQALNQMDVERQREWGATLKTDLGKDYEPMLAAGEAYLNKEFEDNIDAKNELLNARLPGGGRLGDNPIFIKWAVDRALQNGFADRIEANEIETQGGQSLGAQQLELEKLRTTNKDKYDLPETQAKLNRLIELRLKRGEINEQGDPVRKRRTG